MTTEQMAEQSTEQTRDALKAVNKLVAASAKRQPSTRPLFNSGGCTHPGCTRCGSRPRGARR